MGVDVERSKEDSQDLSIFLGEQESKTSNNFAGHQHFEEALLFDCAFVDAKNEDFLDILDLVLFAERLKGPI